MADKDIALMAHLFRRAGFGATREELEAYCAKGYEATVEELLHPENAPDILEHDLVSRYVGWSEGTSEGHHCYWIHRMINTKRPLQEKIALFWHGILCVGRGKVQNTLDMDNYLEMLRRLGLGDFRALLVELSRDPAMIFYLDNCLSHKGAINENYGRELLELFAMGVGMDGHPNYTEEDVKACARAFTGWTHHNRLPPMAPFGSLAGEFKYDPTDHDDDEKIFLGEMGRFNGEDVVDIIVKQPAAARFVARHLYNYFVADDVQVPAWQNTPPRDPEAIRTLERAFVESKYEIRSVLRVLFNSDFFKNSRFSKVKSPAEMLVGVARLVGDFKEPRPGYLELRNEMIYMGMELLNPPSVEGWHTGMEWIDSGALVGRHNFATKLVGNTDAPGVVRNIVTPLAARGPLSPQQFVEGCLELMGPMEVSEGTKKLLVEEALRDGELIATTPEQRTAFTRRVGAMLQLIVATREYQFC